MERRHAQERSKNPGNDDDERRGFPKHNDAKFFREIRKRDCIRTGTILGGSPRVSITPQTSPTNSCLAPANARIGRVGWVETKMQGDAKEKTDKSVVLDSVSVDSVLKKGFGGAGHEFEERATEVQLSFERWVLRIKEVC